MAAQLLLPFPAGAEPGPLPAPPASPGKPSCQACGAAPGVGVVFRETVGLVLVWRRTRYDGVFCRDCGRALGRRIQNRTLWRGWWGFISAFVNVWYVLANAVALNRLRRLAPPAPAGRSGEPGAPVLQRSGPWFVAAVFAVGLIAAESTPPAAPTMPLPTAAVTTTARQQLTPRRTFFGTSGESAPTWRDGACISISGVDTVRAVDCSGPNNGEIISVTFAPSNCPSWADSYVERGTSVYCISRR